MQGDRTYTRVLGFTELGILEMTRKRKKAFFTGRIIKRVCTLQSDGLYDVA